MATEPDVIKTEDADIKSTDIIFDCPHCSKSLAIDYRGAGLTVHCSDCNGEVEVPIPEGMELDDIDSTTEEQEIRIMHLRKSLVTSQTRVSKLENTIEELTARREALEKGRTDSMNQIGQVMEKLNVIESALKTAVHAIEEIAALSKSNGR